MSAAGGLPLPTLAGIEDAAAAIGGRAGATPLVEADALSAAFGAEIWLKNETVAAIGSYKLRGALTALLREQARNGLAGACTSSSGNHGLGVAHAARLLGVPAHVIVPEGANPLKAAAIRRTGAHLSVGGSDIDGAKAAARDHAAAHGLYFVDDGENADMMDGAGTIGLEIGRDGPAFDRVYVPMGSGNLAGGTAAALAALRPDTEVIAVNGEGSTAMAESFRAGHAVERPITASIDGINTRVPARLALAAVLAAVADVRIVTEADIFAAVHALAECAHVLVEPASASTLAAAWADRADLKGRRVCLVLTGSNITMPHLRRALAAPSLLPSPATG